MLSYPLNHYSSAKVEFKVNPCVRVTCQPENGQYDEESGCQKGRTTIKSFGTNFVPVTTKAYTRESVSRELVAVATLNPMLAIFSGEMAKHGAKVTRAHHTYCPGRLGESYVELGFKEPVDGLFFCGLADVECIRFFYDPVA